MPRNIFVVDAYIVDANGSYAHLNGYPKPFDSKNYDGDVDRAFNRASGAFADAWSGFCSVDNRQIQMVIMYDIFGNKIDYKTVGKGFPVEPEPTPEPTPEPEPVEE